MCEICKGSKHIKVNKDGRQIIVRCECLLKEELSRKLESFNLSLSLIEDLLVKGKLVESSQHYEFQLAQRVVEAIRSKRTTKKPVVCLTSRSQNLVSRFLAILIAMLSTSEISMLDISDLVTLVFSNTKISLNKLTILTTYFDTTKSVSTKIVSELYQKATMENRVIILVAKDTFSVTDLEVFDSLNDVFLFPKLK